MQGAELTQSLEDLQRTLDDHTEELLRAQASKEEAQSSLQRSQLELEAVRGELSATSSKLQVSPSGPTSLEKHRSSQAHAGAPLS